MEVLGVLVALSVLLEIVSATSLGVVSTEGGMVEGQNLFLGYRRYMDVFRGIPFADLPGRFEKPVRHPGWSGILKTTEYRDKCLQLDPFMTVISGSEDCLYLNIWVPHLGSVASNMPVMVWIYGGAFMFGDSMGTNFLDNYLYSGQELADRGNVIVVTLGYRVGTLGFLSTGDSAMPGNYGLWDQQAAIAWVHRNIRSFGGDPSNITIFGESAGGASVSFQTLTPHNKGLIRRAISQSGVSLCPWALNRNPRKYAEEVALKVNCPTDSRMVSCLKMTDPRVLTKAGTVSLTSAADDPFITNLALSPVVDGDFLPNEPSNLFHNAADIDYLAGANDMDANLFASFDVPSINSPLLITSVDEVKKLIGAFTKEKGTLGFENGFSTYTLDWEYNPSQETIKKTVVAVETDYIFLIPTQAALYLHASNARTGRTYSYLFSEPNRLGPYYKPWLGADHTDDLQYVFGKPFSTPLGYWPKHRDLSGYMIAYWTNFAKTGDPNIGDLSVPATWPTFTSTGHKFLEINSKMDASYVRQKLRMRYVNFWTSVLPNLPAMLGILVATAVLLETVSAASLGIVSTEGGMVEGENIRLGYQRDMDVFKGIPFAAVPGRFEKPKRHSGWDGILKATNFKERCLQLTVLMNDVYGSEDCLYLNIWVPHHNSVATNLPVMVWIFGGGFLVGASMGANFLDNYLYSGQEIADRGNVIVVTLGYRVGSLGFLSTGDSSLPGNYGLWDQQAAIAWVHRNIRSFGGDPSKITLFGESAGGASVSFQTLTPHNKGIIKRAISQSGVALCPWAVNRNPRKFAEEVALKVNCPTDSRMAACLKMTNSKTLTMAGTIDMSGSPDAPLVYKLVLSPVIDGDFLPDDPSNLFHNAANIDYMAGANDMDGHIFTGFDVPSVNSALVDTPVDEVKRLLSSLTKEKGTLGSDNAFSTYSLDWGSKPSREAVKKTVVAIETDYLFLIPTQAALYLHASKAGTGRTYSYLFSEPNRLGGLLTPFPSWLGADHADDLQYVFGKPFTTPLGYWPRHRDASGYMIAYWTNFAKTGDPNRGGLNVPVSWPAFTSSGHQFVEINGDMDASYVRQKLRMRYVNFWTSVLPNLPTMYSDSE
ncbi:uncharacterized protein FYW61_015025 [Anableps anableps]